MNTLNTNCKYFHTTHWFSRPNPKWHLRFCFAGLLKHTWDSNFIFLQLQQNVSPKHSAHRDYFFFRWEGARLTWGCEEFRRLFSNQKKNQGWMICEGFIFLINSIRQVEKLSACCAGCSREQMTCFGGRDNPVVYFPPNRNLSSDSCADSESRKLWQ